VCLSEQPIEEAHRRCLLQSAHHFTRLQTKVNNSLQS
jgi:hypothetical protein